ncbi:MAG: hypothetical protein EXR67_07460 [Dehalococcoidia bacterium]|nr:hypothetical protein [Dehalococcoidia bacterium]
MVAHAGAEGPVGGTHTLIEQLAKDRPGAYEQLAQFAAQACELPQFRDTTDHLNIVARKPSR